MKIPENKRLVTIVSVLLVTGFLATTLASYFVSSSVVRETIVAQQLPLTADNIYSEIQRDLLRPIFISSLMAQDTFLRDWAIKGEKDDEAVVKYLKAIMDRYGAFTSFFVSEKTRVYYHASGIFKKVDENDPGDKWYFRVREMKPDYEINVDPDHVNQETMTIFINYRVFDYSGKFIGVTGVGLAVESVQLLIENYKMRYHRNIFFVDHTGAVVLVGYGMSAQGRNINNDAGYGPISQDILAGKKTRFKYNREGETILLNSRYIPELNWYLIVEQAEDPALSALRKTLAANLAVCLLITLVVLLLTNFTVRMYQGRLEVMASTDKLTGLLNRQAFELIYGHVSKESLRAGFPLSIIIFDIDHFKQVNDTYGHSVGDLAIQLVTSTLTSTVRAVDTGCRWGGEEFVCLMDDCRGTEALHLAEKIRANISGNPLVQGPYRIEMTVSLGVAQWDGKEELAHLIHRADEAMYSAKQAGRNRAVLAS
ncbi:MAG: GGDEF domain-containing protein [Nitrospinae bacterium]|nr:GGDEF domain-containing protein [Nitrospinota bacterium]